MTHTRERLFCCRVDPDDGEPCGADGEIFELIEGRGPDEYTHSCRAHVGEALDATKTTTVLLIQAAQGERS
jgi:hypothetical protein